MIASDIMARPVYIVSPKDTVAHARNMMLKHKISRCPVMNDGNIIGIITKKDLAWRLRQSEPMWRRRPIDHIPVEVLMTPDPITVSPNIGIHELASIMVDNDIGGLPVREDDEITGIVTKSDLITTDLFGEASLKASDLMKPVQTVSRYHSLDHIIDILGDQNDKSVVVNNDGTLAGIITESNLAFFTYVDEKSNLPKKDVRFLRKGEAAGRKQFRYVMEVSALAEDVMTRPVVTTEPEASIADVIDLMVNNCINSVVVTEKGELRGIVKRDDIIQEVAK